MAEYHDVASWTFGNDDVEEHDKILIDAVQPSRSLSKSEARDLVERLVGGLSAQNGGKPLFGDVLCLHTFNDILFPIILLGVIAAGGVFTGTNPAYTSAELAHHFRTSRTRFVVTEPEYYSRIADACLVAGIPKINIWVLDSHGQEIPEGAKSWRTLLSASPRDWKTLPTAESSTSTTAALFSTSGTTGLPKMAARTHHSLIAECEGIIGSDSPKPYKQVRLISAPFFHAFASPLANLIPLRIGAPTYVMRRYDQAIFLSSIERFGVTETAVVPPMLIKLMSLPLEQRQMLKTLETVWCGGAPLDAASQEKALGMFAPEARIAQVWGMTECGWISSFGYPEKDNTGSVGRAVKGAEVRLVDDSGNELTDPEASGEILIRHPAVMREYLGNAKATEESITKDGWLRTGDVACLREGKIYIVDRKKELIKVRGWQVAPAELEGMLLRHPAVVDAAVIGIQPVGRDSEIPRAYVVLRPGSHPTASDIKTFMLQNLAKYKVMDIEVCFRADVPKSPSGKILRKILREEVAKEAGVETVHVATGAPEGKEQTGNWYDQLGNNTQSTTLLSVILLGTFVALGVRELPRFVSPGRALFR